MNRNSAQHRCTERDYRQLFSSSASELFELCFILTADEKLARASFEAALECAVREGSSVFREWMRSWARRQIIKACIAAFRPEIQSAARVLGYPQSCDLSFSPSAKTCPSEGFKAESPESALSRLDALGRFVFVLRNVEGYSVREIALLLDVGPSTSESAYRKAIEIIGGEWKVSVDRVGERAVPQECWKSDDGVLPRIHPRYWEVLVPAEGSSSALLLD